jgi:pimeloyl-ACP methyl ester carboxylesterase
MFALPHVMLDPVAAIGIVVVGGIALLIAGALYQSIGARRSAQRYAPPGSMIHVGERRLHALCRGTGRPAVLLESGIAASSLSWTRVLPDIAAFTRACAYDRAGLAWSDPPRGPRTVDRMLSELRQLLAAVELDAPYVIVGHSFGTFLACAFAAERPKAVAGLVLLDPPSEWHELTARQRRLLRGGIVMSRFGGVLARVGVVRLCTTLLLGGAPGVPRNFVKMFGPTTARTLERLVGEIRKLPPEIHPIVQTLWCQPKCFSAMAGYLAALEETADTVGRLRGLPDIPLVVISSSDQPTRVLDRHRALAQLSAQGRHVIAARSGHWIQFDEPEIVVNAVREVVGRVRKAM